MASTWWIRDWIQDYAADPKVGTLTDILTAVVEALDDLDREKADEAR